MVELLTHVPTLSVTKERTQILLGKNRTHDFRTSRCAAYLLDHSGDDCYLIFYYVWAEPLLIVLLSKIMGGDCDAIIFATAQAIFWPTRVFGVCSKCLFVLTHFTFENTFAAAQAIFWPTRTFGVCSECLFVLTRFTCGNRGKFHMSWFQLARAPKGRC